MLFYFRYTAVFIISTFSVYAQDTLIKKDSSKVIAKILEIRPTEIKYKLFNYQEGPDYIISKNEVAYAIYSNGVKEIFNSTESSNTDNVFVNPTPPKGSVRRPDSIGNYIKFNVQVGTVINSLSSNFTRREPQAQRTSSEKYSASNNKYVLNYNIGFNFLFGSNTYIKHVIGVNYLRSTGEYNYSSGSLGSSDGYGGRATHSQDFHYVSKLDFINIVTGLRFKLFKKLYIEPLAAINIIAQSDVRQSGTSTTQYISGGPTPNTYKTETEYFENKKVSAEHAGINSTISLCPKISYDFDFKRHTLSVYISYNLAYEFRLPWMMAGISYYPLKKLK